MSETKNLKLLKHDNPSTNTEQFDVENYLNKNWDKLDNEVGTARIKVNNLETDNTTNKQDITNIKAKDTEQDKYIAELEAENARLREDLNGLPKGQASGESIDLNDSAEMRCELKISGNSKQETRSGKNLLEFVLNTQTVNGLTITNNGDGSLSLNGTTTDVVSLQISKSMANLVAGTYYLSRNSSGTVSDSFNNLLYGKNDNTAVSLCNFKTEGISITTTTDYATYYLWLYVKSGITFTNYVMKPQLESGTATEWEQYGASPSPDYPSEVECCGDNINIFDGEVEEGNIDASTGQNAVATNAWRSKNYLNVKDTSVSISVKDLTFSSTVGRLYFYKSDNTYISNILINSLPFTATLPNETAKVRFFILNSVADINAKIKLEKGSTVTPYSPPNQGSINEVICNKNIFNLNDYLLNMSLYSDGSIKFGQDNNLYYIPVQYGKKYIMSLNTTLATNCVYGYTNEFPSTSVKSTYNILNISNLNNHIFEPTNPDNKYLCIRINYVSQLPQIANIQLEEGQTATEYVEHKSQTYTIPTQQPMRAIGNVRDKFILKENGKWYERHNIARKIFDGTENFNLGTNANSLIYFFTNAGSIKAKSQDLLCNKLTTVTNLWNETENKNLIAIRSALDLFNIMLSDTTINTVEKFKSWLSEQYNAGTPVYVDYILETPLDIECTEEQSTILFDIEQNAKTYDKVTHMYSTDNVSPVIDVTYKKDIETLFANTLVEGV